jgi:hypothetical protein
MELVSVASRRSKCRLTSRSTGRAGRVASTFRLAIGRCSCTEPQPDVVRQTVCRELMRRLSDVSAGRPFCEAAGVFWGNRNARGPPL